MTPAEIFSLARNAGVSLRAEDDRIVAGPRGAVTDELRILIRANKAALLAFLSPTETDVAHVAGAMGDQGRQALGSTGTKECDLDDLREMDRLLRELAKFEGWTASELEQQLDERRRMAAVNVPGALQALREAVARCESILPEKPKERAKIVLCRLRVIEGGKSRLPTKSYDLEPEAA